MSYKRHDINGQVVYTDHEWMELDECGLCFKDYNGKIIDEDPTCPLHSQSDE